MFGSGVRIKGGTKEEKLKFLNSLAYDVRLKQKGTKFYLLNRELSLLESNDSLETAYEDLDERKKAYFVKMIESESEDGIILPRKYFHRDEMFFHLKIFVLKAIIICVLAGATLSISGALLVNKANYITPVNTINKAARAVLLQIERFANKPEEEKQKALSTIRKAFEELKPVADEFHDVFSQPNGNKK